MHRFAAVFLCTVCVFTVAARGQSVKIEAVRAPMGTVLAFHLQTRLNPADRNEMDVLPRGTVIRVKLLSGVDSSIDPGWKRVSRRGGGIGFDGKQDYRALGIGSARDPGAAEKQEPSGRFPVRITWLRV